MGGKEKRLERGAGYVFEVWCAVGAIGNQISFEMSGAGDWLWAVCNGFKTLGLCLLGGAGGRGERWEGKKRDWNGEQVMFLRCGVLWVR